MSAILILLSLVGLTISIVLLVLVIIFLYEVPKYLDKIADALQFANHISYRNYEDSLDK